MLKNITVADLMLSKTFWGALVACGSALAHAWAQWQAGQKAEAINEALVAIGALIAAIGVKDATAAPK